MARLKDLIMNIQQVKGIETVGMYTELVLKATIRDNVPPDILAILLYLFGKNERPKTLPDHPFFRCARWNFIGKCNSYYHIPHTFNFLENNLLFSRCDLKNYDHEIEQFIDWVVPYLDHLPGACIGWTWYEEWKQPKLIIMPCTD